MFKLLLAITLITSKSDTLAPIRITNLLSGDKDSKVVYVGIVNKFRIADSTFTGMVYQDHVTLTEGNILTVMPVTTGNMTITFLRGEERMDIDLKAKLLGLVSARPNSAVSNAILLDSLDKDPSMDFESPDKEDLFKGFRVSAFTASLNNSYFPCKDSFSPELLKACREARSGDMLRITELVIASPETGITRKITCNQHFILKASISDSVATH